MPTDKHEAKRQIIRMLHEALQNYAHACDDERIYSFEPETNDTDLDIQVADLGDWRIKLEDCNYTYSRKDKLPCHN